MTKVSDVVSDVTSEWGGATPASQLSGEDARTAQINAKVGDDLKRRLESEDEVGGDESAPVATEVAETFPNCLATCLNILQDRTAKFESITDDRNHRRERMAAFAALGRIRKHVGAIQQGNHAPVASMNSVRSAELNHKATAATKRGLEINRLKLVRMLVISKREDVFTPILSKSLSRLPKEHRIIARTPREVLLAEANCRDQLHFLLSGAAEAEIKKLELFPVTNIEDRIAELAHQIDGSKDADEIEQVQAELARLRSKEAEHIATLRRREVTPLVEFAQQVADAFIKWAVGSLESCHAEALSFECQMLADLSLPHEVTVVSRRYTQAIAEVKRLNTPLKVLNWFGMPSLTHVAEQLEQSTS